MNCISHQLAHRLCGNSLSEKLDYDVLYWRSLNPELFFFIFYELELHITCTQTIFSNTSLYIEKLTFSAHYNSRIPVNIWSAS